ncbi:MAG TPA: hypothetical protein VF525_01840 [Pyrinomonadaceae bacterium]|jgi:hypothetical protein
MTENNGHHQTRPAPPAPSFARRRSPWPLVVVAALLIIVPFIFWYGTWFGRPLSDAEIEKYLRDEANPRHEQHALAQIAGHMEQHDADVHRWYPQIAGLASSRHADVRMTTAWVMGKDARAPEFHAALGQLLADAEPIVRRNAALALVPANDASGRAELLAMLRPYTFNSPRTGQLVSLLAPGTPVKRDSMLARIRTDAGAVAEIRSPLPGRIAQSAVAVGAQIVAGQPLVTLAPDEDSVLNALVALRFVATTEDLPEIERYAAGAGGLSAESKREAALTVEAIKRRAAENNQTK